MAGATKLSCTSTSGSYVPELFTAPDVGGLALLVSNNVGLWRLSRQLPARAGGGNASTQPV
jgi:hypothetical protein